MKNDWKLAGDCPHTFTIRVETPEETAARKAQEAATPGYCDWATEVFIVETLVPIKRLPTKWREDLP